jgi:hypothetical protein
MSHVTLAASDKVFKQLFKLLVDNFTFAKSDSGSFGPFSASYAIALHLQNGSVTLNDDNTVEVDSLEIVFDTLKVQVCFNLPGIPGFCIVPDPWNGCLVGFPGIDLGSVCVPVDLSGLVSKIIKVKAGLKAKYFVDPARLPGWSDLDAEFNGKSNMWQVFINPTFVNVEPIDIPATISNIFENAVKNVINTALGPLPGWMKDAIFAFIGPILDMIKSALGIADSIDEFFQNLLSDIFPIPALIETAVADYFADKYPIQSFEDPYPLPIPDSSGLIPVKIPIRNLNAQVNSKEMILGANVGP